MATIHLTRLDGAYFNTGLALLNAVCNDKHLSIDDLSTCLPYKKSEKKI